MTTPSVPRSSGQSEVPSVGELLDLVGRLDSDNERLRLRLLDVIEWMEESVSEQVRLERVESDLRSEIEALRAEVAAITGTRSWRLMQPLRRGYGRIRARGLP